MTRAEYNKCVDEYADRVYRFILKNSRSKEDAEDIVQNAFANLWRHHQNVEYAKARAYLFTSAYNSMIDMIRKRKYTAYIEETKVTEPSVEHKNHGLKEVLGQALTQLPEVQRTVMMLRDYEGYSYKEIGDMVSLNESQVKVYLFRARQRMKDYIKKLENVL